MSQCPDKKGLVMGNAGIIRIAKGCPDQVPAQDQFLRLGALTSKSFDFGMEKVPQSLVNGNQVSEVSSIKTARCQLLTLSSFPESYSLTELSVKRRSANFNAMKVKMNSQMSSWQLTTLVLLVLILV